MTDKHWITAVLQSLEQSLVPIPHEVNELDWKVNLSDHKDRLAEHMIAFANHPNGGSFVFGVANSGHLVGIDQDAVAQIANTLSNLGRDAVEPPLALDHAVVEFKGMPILLVHVPELIGDTVALGRIKRKDAGNGKKFAEYLPYWA